MEATTAGHRVLAIANDTCPCPELLDELVRRAAGEGGAVLIVAPALNSRMSHWLSDTDGAVESARGRLATAVDALSDRGVDAQGQVGDGNPRIALDDWIHAFSADEVVIATHPAGHSHWLESGLVEHARSRYEVPITHIVSEYGLVGALPG